MIDIQEYVADRISEEIDKNENNERLKELVYFQLRLLQDDYKIWFDHMKLFINSVFSNSNVTLDEIQDCMTDYSIEEQIKMVSMSKIQAKMRDLYEAKDYITAIKIIIEVNNDAQDYENVNVN